MLQFGQLCAGRVAARSAPSSRPASSAMAARRRRDDRRSASCTRTPASWQRRTATGTVRPQRIADADEAQRRQPCGSSGGGRRPLGHQQARAARARRSARARSSSRCRAHLVQRAGSPPAQRASAVAARQQRSGAPLTQSRAVHQRRVEAARRDRMAPRRAPAAHRLAQARPLSGARTTAISVGCAAGVGGVGLRAGQRRRQQHLAQRLGGAAGQPALTSRRPATSAARKLPLRQRAGLVGAGDVHPAQRLDRRSRRTSACGRRARATPASLRAPAAAAPLARRPARPSRQ